MKRIIQALLFCGCAMQAFAQDSTRGVRIGLTYDPGTKPGVIVMPVRGDEADSIRTILQRDLNFGDRVNVLAVENLQAGDFTRGVAPSWAVLAKFGAAAMVQITPTATGLHLAVYDIARQTTALIRDYRASTPNSRDWRGAIHTLSDDVEELLTGTRGIARTRVLFERGDRIWVVDSDGEQALPLTDSGISASPSWNSTGSAMAYVSLKPAQVVVYDFSTRRSRAIAGGSGVYISPVFAPDGSSIVYAHGVEEGVDLYSTPLTGGGTRRLSIGRGSDNVQPTFNPDGGRIAFMSARSGHPEIYTMDADGTDTDLLTTSFAERAHRASPDWSPDGSRVAFHSQVGSDFQVMTVSLRDKSIRQLTSDGENKDPSWAPDARHLVFVSNRSGTRHLWVLDVETGRARQLTHGGSVKASPSWSRRLAAP